MAKKQTPKVEDHLPGEALEALAGVAPPDAPTAEEATPPLHRWRVALPHSPTLELHAPDADAAWESYKAAVGLLGTIHTPEVSDLGSG